MSYKEFLENIDHYIGKVVEFTSRLKANGQTFKSQRHVWDNKEFAEPKEDALIEVIEVEVISDGKTKGLVLDAFHFDLGKALITSGKL